MIPAFLLTASSTPGLTVCVRPSAPCLPATCQFYSRSHSLCPSICCLPSFYLPVRLQVSQCVRLPAPCLHAICQLDSRSHSRCPSNCSLPSCYLPDRLQVSKSVSVHLLPVFLLPASSTPGHTVRFRQPSRCLSATCQFDSCSHSLCPSICSLPSCYLPVLLQVS